MGFTTRTRASRGAAAALRTFARHARRWRSTSRCTNRSTSRGARLTRRAVPEVHRAASERGPAPRVDAVGCPPSGTRSVTRSAVHDHRRELDTAALARRRDLEAVDGVARVLGEGVRQGGRATGQERGRIPSRRVPVALHADDDHPAPRVRQRRHVLQELAPTAGLGAVDRRQERGSPRLARRRKRGCKCVGLRRPRRHPAIVAVPVAAGDAGPGDKFGDPLRRQHRVTQW